MSFQIIRQDITKVKADAIVNTANPRPIYAGGTDCAIYEAAGAELLLRERQKIGHMLPGQAAETPAFRLKAKYILHTVGPEWQGGSHGELDILRACYENCLKLALKLKCRSIAFPLIATGSYGFPKDKALQTALSVIQPFLLEHSMRVTLVVFNKEAFELSGQLVDKVRAYVDSVYVEEAYRREYRQNRRGASRGALGNRLLGKEKQKASTKGVEEEEALSFAAGLAADAEVRPFRREEAKEETRLEGFSDATVAPALPQPLSAAPSAPAPAYVDLDAMLKNAGKTFQERLFEIIDQRQLSGPQVYKNYISKQVYSKIQGDKDYHPNKYTALALCLSLRLSLEDTLDLMGRAGWTLSQSSKPDVIVRGCILNKEYNPVNINMILFDYDCPCLDKIK
ncbi:MAG: macro domain-containing protein [Oscillospiraceae bacterium]|nr:macro domain-containing protein [Oscillospiraceae bacterium]